ncbi:MAG: UDP-N-acetylmuramoylalanine--D-glutamate ligase [Bdellovibrionales bacterium RIFCSPHIGHO2_01_FULL_40_29]|nr:MAG: UDP-N-acetylmuramoylalanine--D-glutamate ligase [Bdellovibrionales bacterium RIFCSPHIGHO2_01_FULL_40_29]OFZ34013.1 MAG: UDP-N-acetylmuramoylalanine--D-glutamate ligase [Bdellovibrionales bacterium RIFCSPHIGHO2_02_FULL_40_15]
MWKNVADLKDKKILIVGLGKTGVSLAKFLTKHEAQVTVTDHKSKPELANTLEQLDGYTNIKFELGSHSPKTFLSQDLVILSPGVAPHLKIFEYARQQGIKITGEFEFSSQFIQEPIVGVTGTNGKTLVARIAESMLKESGVEVWVGGSNENPITNYLLQDKKAKVVIAEVSSFMLEHCNEFSPANIVFTNLAENHLDRYRSMEEYVNAKRRIFKNTSQASTSILNADDNAVVELARDPAVQRGRIFYFSRKPALEPQIMNIGGAVNVGDELRVRTGPEIETFSIKNIKMKGKHSIENIMAALLLAREYGATHEAVQKVIDSFLGLKHRLEYVRKVGGVLFYNDSKATNVHAVLRALDCFDENVILIAGGKDTNLNYEPLRNIVKRKVKTLILVGEAKERINRDLGDFSETYLIGTFEEAILIAYQKSRIADVVLMSPGCSSFDMFDSYAERGDYFKEIVKKFK